MGSSWKCWWRLGLPVLLPMLVIVLGGCSGGKNVPVKVHTLTGEESIAGAGFLQSESRYLLGPGDLLRVSFLGEEILNNNLRVTPDGYVSVPLVDRPVLVAGMTIDEFKQVIEKEVSQYLIEPKVYLHMIELGEKQVFVLGQVANPHIATSEPLTLTGVISACGGIKEDGQRKQIIVIRRNAGGEPTVFEVNFLALLNGESLLPDIPLQRYDIVIVPKSRIAKMSDFIQSFFGDTIAIPRLGVEMIILQDALERQLNITVTR